MIAVEANPRRELTVFYYSKNWPLVALLSLFYRFFVNAIHARNLLLDHRYLAEEKLFAVNKDRAQNITEIV